MKTVGERIRQARLHRGLSGEELAAKVGYKTQSGIANLENRAGSSGGHKLPKIAEVLNFSVAWFLSGPDVADMTQVPAFDASSGVKAIFATYTPTEKNASIPAVNNAGPAAPFDLQTRAFAAIRLLNEEGLLKAIDYLEMLAHKHAQNSPNRAGISVPATKAA
jgi:transcriptional regulator with XRE-family HTH domain